MRKRLFALDADLFPDVPVEAEMVTVEGAQTADGLVEGGGGELAVVLEVDEEVEYACRGQCGEIFVREVTVELEDPAMVAIATALGEAFELDEAGEVLIPRNRRECVYLFFICVIRLTARVTPFNAELRNRRPAALFNKTWVDNRSLAFQFHRLRFPMAAVPPL